jgi:hypothetical protein
MKAEGRPKHIINNIVKNKRKISEFSSLKIGHFIDDVSTLECYLL